MRDRIEAWPDGRYEFGLDIDGYLETVHLHAVVTIDGRDVLVDYAGTSPEVADAAINCTYNTTRSSTMYPFKCALVPGIPNNEGLFAPDPRRRARGLHPQHHLPAPGQRPRQDHQQHQPGALRRALAGARRARPGRIGQHLAVQRQRPHA
jgi:N-methylhydantoinase B